MRRPLLFVLLAASACDLTPAPVPVPPEPPIEPHWEVRVGRDGGSGSSAPVPLARPARRLSVDQLEASLKATFGETWRRDLPTPDGGTVPFYPFEFIAPVLGRPDYLSDNRESLEVSTTFAKFMDNMATSVCFRTVSGDYFEMDVTKRIFWKYPTDTARTLRYAKLRFHGTYVAPTETEPIAELTQVLEAARLANPFPTITEPYAWVAVCTAMVTDPQFLLY